MPSDRERLIRKLRESADLIAAGPQATADYLLSDGWHRSDGCVRVEEVELMLSNRLWEAKRELDKYPLVGSVNETHWGAYVKSCQDSLDAFRALSAQQEADEVTYYHGRETAPGQITAWPMCDSDQGSEQEADEGGNAENGDCDSAEHSADVTEGDGATSTESRSSAISTSADASGDESAPSPDVCPECLGEGETPTVMGAVFDGNDISEVEGEPIPCSRCAPSPDVCRDDLMDGTWKPLESGENIPESKLYWKNRATAAEENIKKVDEHYRAELAARAHMIEKIRVAQCRAILTAFDAIEGEDSE